MKINKRLIKEIKEMKKYHKLMSLIIIEVIITYSK